MYSLTLVSNVQHSEWTAVYAVQCSYHLSPCSVITIVLTTVPQLCFLSSRFIYFITESLCRLLPFTYCTVVLSSFLPLLFFLTLSPIVPLPLPHYYIMITTGVPVCLTQVLSVPWVNLSARLHPVDRSLLGVHSLSSLLSPEWWGRLAQSMWIKDPVTVKKSVPTAGAWEQLSICENELERTFKAFQYSNHNTR